MTISLQELLETAEEQAIYHAVLKDTNNLHAKEWYVTMYNGVLYTAYDLQCCEYRRNISPDSKWLIGNPVQFDLEHIFAEYTIYQEKENHYDKH